MALAISKQITGQEAGTTLSYSYLYEPLKIYASENVDVLTSIIYADITRIATDTGVEEDKKVKYIMRDIASLGGVSIDLSLVMQQLHDFDTLKVGIPDDIVNGWDSVVSKWIYNFEFYTDQSSTKTEILKLPIIGGRRFDNFVPLVDHTNQLSELTRAELFLTNTKNLAIPEFRLKEISTVTDDDYSPDADTSSPSDGLDPCSGAIFWKSKLGGWMVWGMDLKNITNSHKYMGQLSVGMFESTIPTGGGTPYVQTNYTGTSSGQKIKLKSLSVSAEHLKALAEIAGSPAVYYQRHYTSKLELMKMDSSSAPIKSHINGGDFSVSLSSISTMEQKVK
mgnify:CR=1 FL=1